MSDDSLDLPPTLLQRRRLLTRGAAVAGAAAGAVALSVAGSLPASASDGQALTQGGTYTGGTKTTTLGADSTENAVLQLTNKTGPALQLTSVGPDFDGDLDPGELLAIDSRVLVGGKDSTGTYTTAFATVDDLNSIHLPYAFAPLRLVDTRSPQGLGRVLAVGGGGFDSSGRLKAGAYVDIAVDPADQDFDVSAAFVSLSSTGSTKDGFMVAYPPGNRPAGATVNYQKGVAATSSGLASLGVVQGSFTVRIYTSSTSHVIVDLTGELVAFVPGPAAPALVARKARQTSRRSVARRIRGRSPQGRR